MAVYEVRLQGRAEVAEGTMAFHFEKPPGYGFAAGQFTNVALIDPPAPPIDVTSAIAAASS